MTENVFDDFSAGKSEWIDFDGFGFQVRYASPVEGQRFRNRLVHLGICSKDDPLPRMGREKAFFEALTEKYVIGWRGILPHPNGGEPINLDAVPYSSVDMAKVLSARGDVWKRVTDAIGDAESFFGKNGHVQT